jgi:hypothetical protein
MFFTTIMAVLEISAITLVTATACGLSQMKQLEATENISTKKSTSIGIRK